MEKLIEQKRTKETKMDFDFVCLVVFSEFEFRRASATTTRCRLPVCAKAFAVPSFWQKAQPEPCHWKNISTTDPARAGRMDTDERAYVRAEIGSPKSESR